MIFSGPAQAAVRSYERRQQPQPMSPSQWHALTVVRHWAQEQQRALVWDPRLNQAAAALLPFAPKVSDEPLPLEPLRRAGWEQGWTDGQLAAVAVRLSRRTDALGPILQQALSARLAGVEVNRVGVAVQQSGEETRVVVALSRQLVHLVPVPAQVPVNGTFAISGRLPHHPGHLARLSLAIADASGTVHRMTPHVDAQHGLFAQRLPAGAAPGRMEIQVLVDRGHGPEVAALFPVGVGTDPWPLNNAPVTPAAPNAVPEAALGAHTLAELIWGARDAHGLELPPLHPQLNDAARAHGDDMRAHHYFAHVSNSDGDAVQRLAERGLPLDRVLENIAAAPSIDAAFAQWMDSPAHRANILDPQANVMGVAVGPGPSEGTVLAVLVLARLADSGTDMELTAAALQRLSQARLSHGLEPLALDSELAAMAAARSRANAVQGRLGDSEAITEEVLRHGWSRSAADFYRSQTVDVVVTSPHVHEQFDRVGLGVYQTAAAPMQPHVWITVLYAGAGAVEP